MMFGMAAATSALDLVKSLTQSARPKATGTAAFKTTGTPFSSASTSGQTSSSQSSLISPDTLNALFAAQSQSGTSSSATSRTDALKDLFSKIDGDGDGKISKSEFESALGAGGTNTANADSVFGKLDTDGDGSVSLSELASALKPKKHAHGPKRPDENADALLQALDATSSTSDTSGTAGSSSTASSASTSATRSYSAIEQMIQRQIDTLTRTSASSSLSVSV